MNVTLIRKKEGFGMEQVHPHLLYTREHEWVQRLPSGSIRVGITDFMQKALGDIVFLELPEVGRELRKEDSMGSAESVKSVSDVSSPVNGKVTAVNPLVEQNPGLLNSDPYGEGWIAELEAPEEALSGLLTPEQYKAYVSDEPDEA